MSNVIPFPTSDQRKQAQVSLDSLRDDYGGPDETRIRRENLRLTERNPAPTLSPQVQRDVRGRLDRGEYTPQPPGAA